MPEKSPPVSLFIPCLVEHVLPEIGLAMAVVLQKLGYRVKYDDRQICCGQPAFNAGHAAEARKVARHFLEVFSTAGLIVAPSGSCTGMVRNYFPQLFAGDKRRLEIIQRVQKNIFEFSEFICRTNKLQQIKGHFPARVAIHNSCHSIREIGITDEAGRILQQIDGLEIFHPKAEHSCCGFGGLFSFKMPQIATAMAKTRLEVFADADLDFLIANDPGCIQHLRAEAQIIHFQPRILHLAEFLQMAMDSNPIERK